MTKTRLTMIAISMLAACGGGKGGGGGGGEDKPAQLSLLVEGPASVPGVPCGMLRGSYELTPQTLSGTVGIDHKVTKSFDDLAGSDVGAGPSRRCRWNVSVTAFTQGLRPGVWQIALTAAQSTAICTENLRPGGNLKSFVLGRAGCT